MAKATQDLETIVGGLGRTSKMPCLSWSTPAQACKVGGKLRKVPGSVCSACYACSGNYHYPSVKSGLAKRLDRLADLPAWTQAMIDLLDYHYHRPAMLAGGVRADGAFFRWHDSGDIQSVDHLDAIVSIARVLPHISFWLPTKERGTVTKWVALHGDLPDNLTVRVSAPMIGADVHLTASERAAGVRACTVETENGVHCKAPAQSGKCLDCRRCWSRDIETITYHKH